MLGHLLHLTAVAPKPDPGIRRRTSLTFKKPKMIQTMVEGAGALNRAILERLFISGYTLRNHLTFIY